MPFKHIFGAQIENVRKSRRSKRNGSPLFITFVALIFLQCLITRQAPKRRQAALLLLVFTAFALQERRPWHITWVLPRPQNRFENLLNSNALNM